MLRLYRALEISLMKPHDNFQLTLTLVTMFYSPDEENRVRFKFISWSGAATAEDLLEIVRGNATYNILVPGFLNWYENNQSLQLSLLLWRIRSSL